MSENKTAAGLFWRTLESIGTQGMQFLVQLVLARLLMPEDFGVVAILSIFVNIANTVVQSGLSSALLQRKNPQPIDYHTVFVIEFGSSLVMYGAIFFAAPAIAAFYENPALTQYLRVFAVSTVLCGLSSTQMTTLRFRMDFRGSFFANFFGITAQGITGIVLALCGFGVWSLIWAQVAYRLVAGVLLAAFARYIPKLRFSRASFRASFSYSWKLFVGWMIGNLYNDAFSLIIGKEYNETTLGYYSKGSTIAYVINKIVTQVTSGVMFPAIAKIQDEKALVKQQTRQMVSISAALIFPVMAGFAAAAEPIVMVVLTEKWAPSIPIIQILSIPAAINVISNANMQTFNAIGRSELFLKCEMIKRTLTIALVFVFGKINFYLMLSAIAFMGVISLILNAFYNVRILNYALREQLADLLPYILFSAVLFAAAYVLNLTPFSYFIKLLLQIVVCAALYLVCLLFSRRGAFAAMRNILQQLLHKRNTGGHS